jgi:hypothetical protein
MSCERWSPGEDKYLQDSYLTSSTEEMSYRLKRTPASVWARLRKLGLKAPKKPTKPKPPPTERRKLTDEEVQLIVTRYREIGPRELSRRLNVNVGVITGIGSRNGLTKRKGLFYNDQARDIDD